MSHVSLVLLLAFALTTPERELPALCVTVPRTPAVAAHAPSANEIIAAMRARIPQRYLRVVPCAGVTAPTWELLLSVPGTGGVIVEVRGRDLAFSRTLTDAPARPAELARLIALVTAEALRPVLDSLLAELGFETEPVVVSEPQTDELLTLIESGPPPSVAASPATRQWLAGLSLGATLGARPQHIIPHARIDTLRTWGIVDTGLVLGAELLPTRKQDGSRATGQVYAAGAVLRSQWRSLAVGVAALARVTAMHLQSAVHEVDRWRWYGDVGVGVDVELRLWQGTSMDVGLHTRGLAWRQPRRFLVAGTPIYAQSSIELAIGPVVRLHF